MAAIYLETSFFSACVSTRTGDKSVGWRASSLEWWDTQRHLHDLFVSGEVLQELSAPDFPQSRAAMAMLDGLNLLESGPEIERFAELLVAEKVMPHPALAGDALHVATATVHGMQYILTWNVKHLANLNKRLHLAVICMRLGLTPPMIVTPDLI